MEQMILLFTGLVLWWWFNSFRTQEVAKIVGKNCCLQYGLQLLDDTVVLVRVRIKRNNRGQWGWQRTYYFDFSDSGNNRKSGMIIMWATQLEMLDLPGYEERLILR